MRLCVCVPCFFPKQPLQEAIREISALGYDAAELWGWQDLDVDEVRAALEETGLELLSMCTTEFRMTDPAFRGLWLEGLERSCRMAGQLGVKKLITQVGPDTGAPRQLQRDAIVAALKAAVPILEQYGITLMIEPLNVLVDHPGCYLTSAREGFEIIREVEHPQVKLVYDIYHQQVTEGNILPSILNNLDCIAHLHGAGHPGRRELHLGENNYTVIFEAIDKAGYTGACGLEYHPSLPVQESLQAAIAMYG